VKLRVKFFGVRDYEVDNMRRENALIRVVIVMS
jgi:hypothetical protein